MPNDYLETEDDEDSPSKKYVGKKIFKWLQILALLIFIFLAFMLISYSSSVIKYIKTIFPGTKFNADQTEKLFSPGPLKGEETGNINILMLGMRGEGENYPYLTNAVMVMNYHKNDQKINLFSLPRDLWISTDKYGKRKISYICDTSDFKGSPSTCFETGKYVIRNTLGLDINYVLLLDFKGFTDIIDKAGKIDVDVTGHLKEWTFLTEPDFAGAQDPNNPNLFHLNGKQALIYVRWPKDALPDFNRLERQQQMMKAAENKFISPSLLLNPDTLSSVLQSASTNLKTDFQLWEAKRFSELLKDVSSSNVNKYSLTSVINSDGGLLTETHFESQETLSPTAGVNDYSQIQEWAKSKLR